jgi:hypothetical protein
MGQQLLPASCTSQALRVIGIIESSHNFPLYYLTTHQASGSKQLLIIFFAVEVVVLGKEANV